MKISMFTSLLSLLVITYSIPVTLTGKTRCVKRLKFESSKEMQTIQLIKK